MGIWAMSWNIKVYSLHFCKKISVCKVRIIWLLGLQLCS